MLTVYSKNACGYCVQVKNWLKSKDIEFEEINIDEDTQAREFIISEGHRTMPQIYHNGRLFVQGGAMGLLKLDEGIVRARMGETSFGDFEL